MYVSSLLLSSEHIWHKALLMGYSMRPQITHICRLNDFQMVMGLYRRQSSLFLRVCLPESALPLFDI